MAVHMVYLFAGVHALAPVVCFSGLAGAVSTETARLLRHLLTPAEECLFANVLIQLIELGWELNRDSVRALMKWFLPMVDKKRSVGERGAGGGGCR